MNTTTLDRNELSPDQPAPGLLGLAERGWVPDVLLRAGIRRLCAQRLQEERAGGVEAQSLRQRERLAGQRVGVILSGGNVDLDALPWKAAA